MATRNPIPSARKSTRLHARERRNAPGSPTRLRAELSTRRWVAGCSNGTARSLVLRPGPRKVGLGSISEAEELGHVWSESMMTEVSFERLN